ncbi:hypothetical protein NHX12_007975, partial [Muraenolepis orangiensis]
GEGLGVLDRARVEHDEDSRNKQGGEERNNRIASAVIHNHHGNGLLDARSLSGPRPDVENVKCHGSVSVTIKRLLRGTIPRGSRERSHIQFPPFSEQPRTQVCKE